MGNAIGENRILWRLWVFMKRIKMSLYYLMFEARRLWESPEIFFYHPFFKLALRAPDCGVEPWEVQNIMVWAVDLSSGVWDWAHSCFELKSCNKLKGFWDQVERVLAQSDTIRAGPPSTRLLSLVCLALLPLFSSYIPSSYPGTFLLFMTSFCLLFLFFLFFPFSHFAFTTAFLG